MPSSLGRYAVRGRLGSGAFATVWLAYDEHLDSPVAVKVLADNWTEDHHVRQRFLEEGRFLRRVESPHVVPVYDAGELADGRPYLVMGYADQGTLADRLEAGPVEPAHALDVVQQLTAGLAALHGHGILHRDVKPANVLFRTAGGQVRTMLADLGLGKALDMSSRLTVVGGTPSYVAPEQARGEPLDPRADQYSLGAVTFVLLTGRAPYAHTSLAAAAQPGPPPRLSTPERPLPAQVEAVVRRALAPDREDRWTDLTAYVDALGAAMAPMLGASAGDSWRPADPDRTRPGARTRLAGDPAPEPVTAAVPDPDPGRASHPASSEQTAAARPPRPGRARRRLLTALVCAGAVAAGGAGGLAWERAASATQVTVDDELGALSVTVPDDWHGAVATAPWAPPNGEGATYPALSVGESADWRQEGGEGVFVGILPGDELPDQVPQHQGCDSEEGSTDAGEGDLRVGASVVVASACPDGVTLEQVVLVAENRLLWVQVRSADRATAERVLEDVVVRGYPASEDLSG